MVHTSILWVFTFPHNIAIDVATVILLSSISWIQNKNHFLLDSWYNELTDYCQVVKADKSFCDFKGAFIDIYGGFLQGFKYLLAEYSL